MQFYISNEDWDKIIYYAKGRVEMNGDEVGGMAVMVQDKEGDYIIQDPVILTQETTGSTCTLEKEALADYYIEMAQKHGKDTHFLWWHSHAKMKAFWSGTDTSTMEEYQNGNWSAFLVVNVDEEFKFSVRYWDPVDAIVDVKLGRLGEEDKSEIPKDIMEELKAKCSDKTWVANQYGYGYSRYNQSPALRKQMTIWNQGTNRVDGKELTFIEVCDAVEVIVDAYDDKKITKKQFNKKTKELNKLLEAAKSKFRMKKMTAKELDHNIMHMWPADLIVDEKGKTITDKDTSCYHGMYGGWED